MPSIELLNYEADDLIATYAKKITDAGAKVTVISSDKDLMQLVSNKVRLFDPMKNKVIGEKEVLEKFGVKPKQVIDVQSLAGDSSDNVPGVPGIGIKTAAELINKYNTLENLLNKASEIPQNKRRETLLSNKDKAMRKRVVEEALVPMTQQIRRKRRLCLFRKDDKVLQLFKTIISFDIVYVFSNNDNFTDSFFHQIPFAFRCMFEWFALK